MRLPLSWLKEFVPVTVSAEKLAELLTLSGSEVEKIHRPVKLDKVIVGEIIAIEKHPNADRLRIAVVRTQKEALPLGSGNEDGGRPSLRQAQGKLGSGRELGQALEAKLPAAAALRSLASGNVRRVVCGAPNIKVGQRVPVALPGAVLASGTKIDRREVRGVVSEGMLCGESELGIGSNATDITVLSPLAPLGASVASILGLDDSVLELDITPNRGDCLSVRGLAREIAALTGRKIKNQISKIKNTRSLGSARDDGRGYELSVRVEDRRACPLYFARLIEGVTIGSSPLLLQRRLAAVGFRPINAAVDIANYVMLELGQPLHVFDAAKIADGNGNIALSVRRAKRGESLELLDGKTYELDPDDIVIATANSQRSNVKGQMSKADDLAGVMGGRSSGTTKQTTAIVLEAAIFDPVSIRRTYKRLGLRTEAAIRFEKKVDPQAVEEALDRATLFILEHCGGVVSQTVSVGSASKPSRSITVSPARVSATIGVNVPAAKQRKILTSLGFTIGRQRTPPKADPPLAENVNGQMSKVSAPSWRHDIEGEHDLVEEVGRMLPYNLLAATGLRAQAVVPKGSSEFALVRRVRQAMLHFGFDEVLLYSFYGVRSIERMGLKLGEHFRLENPFNPTQEYLRLTLLPNLLEAAAKNAGLGMEPTLFEIGKVFEKSKIKSPKSIIPDVNESLRLAAVTRATTDGVRALKGAFAAFGLIPTLRVLSRQEAAVWKLRTSILVAEASVKDVVAEEHAIQFTALSSFPPVRRDLSIVVRSSCSYADVAKHLELNTPAVQMSQELFETFEGKPLSAGTKSFSFHLTYSALDRTLTVQEVDRMQGELVSILAQAVGATLRA